MSPKSNDDHRPVFPSVLAEKLMKAAAERGRPEKGLSALLQYISREWIEFGDFSRKSDNTQVQLEKIIQLFEQFCSGNNEGTVNIADISNHEPDRERKELPDNLSEHVLKYLGSIADKDGITPPVSGRMIAEKLARPGNQPTAKQVNGRISILIKLQHLTIETKSGRQSGRRYRMEKP